MTSGTFIYVVEARNGWLKVGVSRSPLARAAAIHQHSPVPCRLIAHWPGSMADEQAIHRQFEVQRGHCEWFRIDGPVAEFAAAVMGRGGVVEAWGEHSMLSRAEKRRRAAETRSKKHKAMWADPAYRARRAEWAAARKTWRPGKVTANDFLAGLSVPSAPSEASVG